jgi:two-component system, NarL family, nitrate/nitrite sensor histidine kinase NarX
MIGVVVPLILVLAIAAQVQFAQHRELMLENLEQFSVSIGESMVASLTRAMLTGKRDELAQDAHDLAVSSSIRNLMILDKQGVVRVASRPADLGTRLPLTDPTCQICHQAGVTASSRSVVFVAADGSRVFRNVTPIRNDVACQSCHGTAASLNGVLIVDLPYEAVDAHLWADLRQSILLAAAAIVLVSIAINLLLSRIVLSKLERFRESVLRYARGDFSARVPVTGSDELGELARTVNDMAAGLAEKAQLEREVKHNAHELQRRSARLDALYRVALESSRSLNLESVMQAGLESARQVMGMEAGEIHLGELASEEFKLSAFVGSPEPFVLEEDPVKRGECLCGGVVARGQTCVVGELCKDARVTRLACQRYGFRAVAAVPLKARGEALGVLTLHSRAPREFSRDDTALLTALGDQLGIAIDNARLYAEMEARVKELSHRVQHLAVSEERVRLAREMHDGFAQALSVLNLKLQMAQGLSAPDGNINAALVEMRQIVDEAYEDVRQAIGDLRMPLHHDGRVVHLLADYVQNFALRYDLQAQVAVAAGAETARCSPDAALQVVRIVQEVLTNVRKHAHAQNIGMQLERQNGCLIIQVRDDGQGFDTATAVTPPGHFGLAVMRERAASFGGELCIESEPGAGTTVTLSVPTVGA